MQDIQGYGSMTVDKLSEQVDELSRFYHWDLSSNSSSFEGHCPGLCHACALPTPHMGRAKALLMKHFQLRDLMDMYNAQFRSCCRWRDVHTYEETLQHLADPAWPFMDYHAKEGMVVDQFILNMGNHELSVQVAAHGQKRVEHILRVT